MKKARAIFFDLDGTLIDTIKDLAAAVNTILIKHNLPTHTYEEYISFIGLGSRHLIKMASGINDEDKITLLYDEYLDNYMSHLYHRTSIYPFVSSALEKFYHSGYELYVFTNKPEEAALSLCKHFFKNIRFKAIISAAKKYPPKPDPTCLIETIKEYELDPEEIMYFGDSNYDMEVAKKVNIPYRIGCAYGYQDKDKLIESGATDIITSGRQFYHIVDKYGFNHSYSIMILFSIMELTIMAVSIFLAITTKDNNIRIPLIILTTTIFLYLSTIVSMTLFHFHYLEAYNLYGFSSAFISSILFTYLFSGSFIHFEFQNVYHLVMFSLGTIFALIFFACLFHMIKTGFKYLKENRLRQKYIDCTDNTAF